MALASELILHLINRPDQKMLQSVRKDILDFVTSVDFLRVCCQFPSSVEVWLKIINRLSFCYPNKNSML